MEEEIWKDLIEYNNVLQISNFGQIKVKEHMSNKTGKIWKEHILSPIYDKNSKKVYVSFRNKRIYLKPLVVKYFLENPNGYKYVSHRDGNMANLRVDNLFWTNTRQYNVANNRKKTSEFDKLWEHRFDHQKHR